MRGKEGERRTDAATLPVYIRDAACERGRGRCLFYCATDRRPASCRVGWEGRERVAPASERVCLLDLTQHILCVQLCKMLTARNDDDDDDGGLLPFCTSTYESADTFLRITHVPTCTNQLSNRAHARNANPIDIILPRGVTAGARILTDGGRLSFIGACNIAIDWHLVGLTLK